MLKELRKEHDKKIDILKTAPLTDLNRLNIKGERLTNPRFSRDGEFLALNRIDPHKHQSIVIVDKNDRRIFFTQADLHRGYNFYQDLYSCDIKKDR